MDSDRITRIEKISSGLGHDLKAPLRAINFYSDLFLEDYEDELDEEALDYLKKIRSGSEKLNLIVRELNIQIKALKCLDQPDVIKWPSFLDEILNEADITIQKSGGDFTFKSSMQLLMSAFKELLNNFRMHAGENANLYCQGEQKENLISIKFYDDGQGLAEKISLDSLFQAGPGSADGEPAYGLYFVRRICQELNGDCKYFEPEGGGFGIEMLFHNN